MKIFAYDSIHKNWLLFKDPLEIFSTHSSQEVSVLLEKIELQSKEKKLHALGLLSYEASLAFDPQFNIQKNQYHNMPLAMFGLFESYEVLPEILPEQNLEIAEKIVAINSVRRFIECKLI